MIVYIFTNIYTCLLVQLQSGVEYIRGIVCDQFSEDQMIEAMKQCNMNAETALNHLLEKSNVTCMYAYVVYYVYCVVKNFGIEEHW